MNMKIKDGFLLREVAGNYVVIAVGEDAVNFNSIITVNEIGAYIWNKIFFRTPINIPVVNASTRAIITITAINSTKVKPLFFIFPSTYSTI